MSLPWYKRLIFFGVPSVAAAATPVVVDKVLGLFGDPKLEIRDFRVEPIPAPPSVTGPVAKRWSGFPVLGFFQSDQPKHLNKIIFVFHKEWGISVQNCKTTLVKDMAESMAISKDIAKYATDLELWFTVTVGGVENGHLKEGGPLKFYVECDGAFSKSVVATLR
jgi:hypothetical protein